MDWDRPEDRARYIERHGPSEYNRALAEHRRKSVVCTVNGHAIRVVNSARFGAIHVVGDTGRGHSTLEGAKKIAEELS